MKNIDPDDLPERLACEMERRADAQRAYAAVLRQAHGLLTEQMDKATEAAAQKIEQRADRAISALERHRDVAIESVERASRTEAREL